MTYIRLPDEDDKREVIEFIEIGTYSSRQKYRVFLRYKSPSEYFPTKVITILKIRELYQISHL